MAWHSERNGLPRVAQKVLLATPRRTEPFWDIRVARILIRHEGVVPHPVEIDDDNPVTFWWSERDDPRSTILVTGRGWWMSLTDIAPPPGAEHKHEDGYDCVVSSRRS